MSGAHLRDLTRDQLVLRLAYLEGKLNEEQASCYEEKFTRQQNYNISVSVDMRVNDVKESDCKLICKRLSDHLKGGMECVLLNLYPFDGGEKISDLDIHSEIFEI